MGEQERDCKHIYMFLKREINIDNNHKDVSIYKCSKCGKEMVIDGKIDIDDMDVNNDK